jgi:Tol biopolymer transport system component
MLRRGLLAVSLIAVAASVGSAAPDARNGQLLYLRPLGGNKPPFGRLFVASSDGSGARDITPAGIKDVQGAAWSPDGRRIAISAIADNDHDGEIFILAADGRVIRQATNNHLSDRHPTWSPDGRRIAFASIRTGLRQIYGMRADGRRQRRLSHQNEDCEDPAWSPSGRWIVFTCQLGYWKLIRMRPGRLGRTPAAARLSADRDRPELDASSSLAAPSPPAGAGSSSPARTARACGGSAPTAATRSSRRTAA